MNMAFKVEDQVREGRPTILGHINDGDPDAFLKLSEAFASQPWSGRMIFFSAVGRGGVDIMSENVPTENGIVSRIFVSRGPPWVKDGEVSPIDLPGRIRALLAAYPLREVKQRVTRSRESAKMEEVRPRA